MRVRLHRILIPFAAFCAILPILVTGPSYGHDFHFHLTSWMEALTQFSHFHYPRWAYTAAYDAGEPRFLFYPPLSWSLGAILGFILPWKLVSAAFVFTALTLSGFTAHRLASRFASANAATLAAVLYLVNPYMLFTAYERSAYGELLAAAWIPLLFLAAFQPRIRILPVAVAVALLWLTNAPAGVMGCYSLAILTLVRLMLTRSVFPPEAPRSEALGSASPGGSRLSLALNTIAGTALGLALAAFYLLPAAYERRYIQADMALIPGMRIMDNTLFHISGPQETYESHDVVLRSVSKVAVALLAGILVSLFLIWRTKRSEGRSLRSLLLPLFVLAAFIAFLLTPPSLFIWRHTPELRFLQFPWRFNAILGAILSLLFAIALDRIRLSLRKRLKLKARLKPVLLAAISLAITAPPVAFCWRHFHQFDPDEMVEVRLAEWKAHIGGNATDEYTPATADNDALSETNPPFWLVPIQAAQPDKPVNTPAPAGAQPGTTPDHFSLTLPTAEFLILNRRQFPDWQIALNNSAVSAYPEVRDDGLITLLLPAGADHIDLSFRNTPDQILGLIVSLLAALILSRTRYRAEAAN